MSSSSEEDGGELEEEEIVYSQKEYCYNNNEKLLDSVNRKYITDIILPNIVEVSFENINRSESYIEPQVNLIWDEPSKYQILNNNNIAIPPERGHYVVSVNDEEHPIFFFSAKEEKEIQTELIKIQKMNELAEKDRGRILLKPYAYGQNLNDDLKCYAGIYMASVPPNYINLSQALQEKNEKYVFSFYSNVSYLYNDLTHLDRMIPGVFERLQAEDNSKYRNLQKYIESEESKIIKETILDSMPLSDEQNAYYAAFFDPLYLERNMDLVFSNAKIRGFIYSVFEALYYLYIGHQTLHKKLIGSLTYVKENDKHPLELSQYYNFCIPKIEDSSFVKDSKLNLEEINKSKTFVIPAYDIKFFGVENNSVEQFEQLENYGNNNLIREEKKLFDMFIREFNIDVDKFYETTNSEMLKIPFFFQDILCDNFFYNMADLSLEIKEKHKTLFNKIIKIYQFSLFKFFQNYYRWKVNPLLQYEDIERSQIPLTPPMKERYFKDKTFHY